MKSLCDSGFTDVSHPPPVCPSCGRRHLGTSYFGGEHASADYYCGTTLHFVDGQWIVKRGMGCVGWGE